VIVSDERIIKHNTSTNGMEYYIKSTGGEDIAVFNSATNSLLWYVQGEVKFPHHSTPDFSANNSNTGATSYTTDPFLIALNQTNSYLYPDMEYKLTDHLGSTRMSYKLNFTCAGVYQNATINYMADYFSFGKIVREYINAGTAAEKYQYTGKERDTESGYDYFNARNYHSEVGRFLRVDPLASKYSAYSPYCYGLNNPIRMVDRDGRAPEDFVILIAKDGAGGKGHMASVIQDGKGNYYYATMGATGGNLSQMASGVQGGMTLMPLTGAKSMDDAVSMAKQDKGNSTYTDEVRFETTSATDQKIFNEMSKMTNDVNSGKVEYNVCSMNCTDTVEKPIAKATGAEFPDNMVPNTNFDNVKATAPGIQADININQGTHEVKFLPSGLDNYPASTRPIIVPKDNKQNNN
jgi:RHS repeat-associated protein